MAEKSAWDFKRRISAVGWVLLSANLLAGCDFLEQLNREVDALTIVITGGSSPLKKAATPSPKPYEMGENAKRSQANGELIHEVIQVVLVREPKGREYEGYVDILNQGASIEGLYNGFTHSSDYRKMEAASGAASPGALKMFGELLVGIEAELPVPTHFDAQSAQPLAIIDEGAENSEGPGSLNFQTKPTPSASPLNSAALADQYTGQFVGASIFTLKRVLGDEALKLMSLKHSNPQNLAAWYSKWVVQMASKGVDFGLTLRNKSDEKFHYDWALKISEDRLKWEVLNRLHRLLNDAERKTR